MQRTGGFAYASPMNAVDDTRFSTPKPTRLELRVAEADVTCKRRTNLVGVWLAVESAYQRQIIKQNAKQFDAAKALIAARARTAAHVLRTGR